MDSEEPDQTFSSADRIRQLNDIDKDVAKLLHSAGLAIKALTNAAPQESESSTTEGQEDGRGKGALETHKQAFRDASAKYFALLSSIDVRLRRQVYALEEAGIIQPEAGGDGAGATTTTAAPSGGAATNPLEISWLNTRKDTVGKDKEAELWAGARELVNKHSNSHTEDGHGSSATDDRGRMEVD